MIQVLPTDTNFRYSPDTGHPDCICSRCGARIREHEFALRMWATNERDAMDEHSREYRYCEKCQAGMGIVFFDRTPDPDLDADDFDPFYDQNPEDNL